MKNLVAIIGFGEAGYHIAKGFLEDGLTNITVFDALQNDPIRGPGIRKRAAEIGAPVSETMEDACAQARFIFSLVTANAAVPVAQKVLPLLRSGQVFVDLNSVAPSVLERIDQLPRGEGALVCDGAVLGNVQKNGHRVSVYLAGSGAQAVYDAFTPYHMKLKVLDSPIGSASGVKMLKSVYSKGLQQLVLEFILSAESYGVLEEMMTSVNNPMAGKTLEEYANEAMPRLVIHAKRRAAEVENAVETVQSLGLDPAMTAAAQRKFEAVAAIDLEDIPTEEIRSMTYQEIARLLLPRMKCQDTSAR